MVQPFPTDWRTALVIVPHPDDPEYRIAAAVAKWTAAGKTVHYALASRGEAGIAGVAAEIAGPAREHEQRQSAAIVGVEELQFWDFPDGSIYDTPELRATITDAITAVAPEVVLTIYGGAQVAPGRPNQRDHVECAAAVAGAFDALQDPPRWLFEFGPQPTHGEPVEGYLDAAIEALATHEAYLSVLDPDTPVIEQARRQVEWVTSPLPDFEDRPTVGFILRRHTGK